MSAAGAFGLDARVTRDLRRFFAARPEVRRVWVFGSRARGDAGERSDLDLAVDAPELDASGFAALREELNGLLLVRGVDLVHWQAADDDALRHAIEAERRVFWERPSQPLRAGDVAALELKEFQREALDRLARYVDVLAEERDRAQKVAEALRAAELDDESAVPDFPARAWERLRESGALPPAHAGDTWCARQDGAGRPIPNVCLKVPTGGGKTLLAASAVGTVHRRFHRRHTGMVLWIVPNEAIYRQTRKALTDRDHPYRQLLNVAGAGRVKILEKDSPLARQDVDAHLCVMLLMLQSAARRSRETLRFFRDRGNVHGFFPREDDLETHWRLLGEIPNLDAYAPHGASQQQAARQKGSIVKDSLGNVMRLLRPMVVIDEQQRAYTENALATIDGFNPSFVLELSATPRVARGQARHGANVLVDVRGADLDRAEMIKLPINVDVRPWPDWKSCLTESLRKLDELEREARALEGDTARYIRPILLVQVERTGADQEESGRIHANDAKALLLQLGLREAEIAIKTAERDDLSQPENQDLLSPASPVRAIITRQALQEGWDCPFAYVLCALAAGRNPSAMTQLVGRILRQPHAAKTGRAPLDECHVFCHDVQTGTVVESIKRSLEGEGMGDLATAVRAGGEGGAAGTGRSIARRRGFESLRIFLPRVTWCEGETRRALDYESDVLADIDWSALDPGQVARDWTPPQVQEREHRLRIDLGILTGAEAPGESASTAFPERVDRVFATRAICDLLPNPWQGFDLTERVVQRLCGTGLSERRIALSLELLVQQVRADVERWREEQAEQVFLAHLAAGRIEFRLRADRLDYRIPDEITAELAQQPRTLTRPDDGHPVEKSLFAPFYESMLDNRFERDFACYLDSQAAVRWWHRNVARSGYALQGWRRNRVYPDFVFLKVERDGRDTLVVMETKGAHLANDDTDYKRRLLTELQGAFRDERMRRAGELELSCGLGERLVCDLVFDENWKNRMHRQHFASDS